jgi:hypothetical protein
MSNKGSCKAAGCDKPVQGKGYCQRHYAQWRKGKLPKPRYKICNAEGCRKPMGRGGLCPEHYAKEHGKTKGEGQAAAPAAST